MITIDDLIPSKYMQDILKKNNFVLTDFNRATIIWNSDEPYNERIKKLKEIADNTEDMILKKQIEERLDYEEDAYNTFAKNPDKKYVFVVEDEQGYSCGFFFDFNMAYEYGKKYVKKWEEKEFAITKYHIVDTKEDLTIKSRSGLNWNMFPEEKGVKTEEEYDGQNMGEINCLPDGTIKSIYSHEMSDEREDLVDAYKTERFEHQFFKIPFEGGAGITAVRDVLSGEVGVLMVGTEEWNNYLKRIDDNHLYVDYSDIQVMVVFLTPKGVWSHEHYNPFYLEPVSISCDPGNLKSVAYRQAMESFIEYHMAEMENRDNLDDYAKKVIETAREYRDVCLEEQAKKELIHPNAVDHAKTVEELII